MSKILTEKQRLKICYNCDQLRRNPKTDEIVNWDACQLGAYITEKICDKHLEAQSAQSRLETLKWAYKVTGNAEVYDAKCVAQSRCRELGVGE